MYFEHAIVKENWILCGFSLGHSDFIDERNWLLKWQEHFIQLKAEQSVKIGQGGLSFYVGAKGR